MKLVCRVWGGKLGRIGLVETDTEVCDTVNTVNGQIPMTQHKYC